MKKVRLDKSYKYDAIRIRDKETGKVRTSRGNADAVAKAMLIFVANGGKLADVAKANDVSVAKGGNAGMFRMNLGTALRGLVRNDKKVKIGSITVSSLKQKVALPKFEPTQRKPAKKAKAKRARSTTRSTATVPAEATA